MNVNMKLTQKLKIQITQLLVAIAYFNVEGGESQEQKGKDEDLSVNTTRELFRAYHGHSESGIISFVDSFCSMTGIYFEQYLENGYASCDSDNVMKLHLKGVLNLDDEKFLRLDDVVRKQLHLSAFKWKDSCKG